MTLEEILREFHPIYLNKIIEMKDRVFHREYNKARIHYRKTKTEYIVPKLCSLSVNGTKYNIVFGMRFDDGTRQGSAGVIRDQVYTFLIDQQGKKVVLQLFGNKTYGGLIEKTQRIYAVVYSSHFMKRYYERTRNKSPEGKSLEELSELFFRERDGVSVVSELDDAPYVQPGQTGIAIRNPRGLILGYIDNESKMIYAKTFVSSEMLFENQEEDFGSGSLPEKIEGVMKDYINSYLYSHPEL